MHCMAPIGTLRGSPGPIEARIPPLDIIETLYKPRPPRPIWSPQAYMVPQGCWRGGDPASIGPPSTYSWPSPGAIGPIGKPASLPTPPSPYMAPQPL